MSYQDSHGFRLAAQVGIAMMVIGALGMLFFGGVLVFLVLKHL